MLEIYITIFLILQPIRPPVRVATPNTVMSQPQSLPLKSSGSTTIPPGYSIVPGGPGNKPMLVQSPMTPEGQKIVTIATTSILSAVNTVSAVAKPGATPTSPSVVISNATGRAIHKYQNLFIGCKHYNTICDFNDSSIQISSITNY